jgi:hypothetical protein
VSNTWWAKSSKNPSYCGHRCSRSPKPCSHARGVPLGRAQPPCPDPDRETWRRRGRTRPDRPYFLSALCTTPTSVSSPEHAHSTPSPRQHPASTHPRQPHPALPVHVASHRPSMPLETLAPVLSRAYKNPPSTPRRSPPSPLPIPTLLSSSLPRNRPSSARESHRVLKDSGHRGHAAGARRRSQAAAAVLRRHRRPLLPLRRAPTVEHSSLQAPVSSSPSRGRRRTCAVGF